MDRTRFRTRKKQVVITKSFYLRSMQLFHNPEITNNTTEFYFSIEESKHIVKVLRKKIGDILDITNGMGWLFTSKIISADIKKCVVSIETKKHFNQKKTIPYILQLYQLK